MTTQLAEHTGILDRLCYTAEGEGRRFVIASLDDGSTVKGEADPNDFIPGIKYRFFGRPSKPHPKYGPSFEFKQYTRGEPHSRGGVVSYLIRFATGIGPVYASHLWDAFGTDAPRMLRTEPETVAAKLAHIPISKLRDASAALQEMAATEGTRIELATLFDGRGFSSKLADTLIKKWGVHAPQIVRRDPFTLLVHRFPSCGFARCDRLYMDLGLPPDRLKRQLMSIWRALQEDSSGHTWFPVSIAEAAVKASISGVSDRIDWKKAVKLGLRAGWLRYRRGAMHEHGWISDAKKADAESRLSASIIAIMRARPGAGRENLEWPDPDSIEGATQHQRDVCRQIFRGRIAILGGSPGTGKTTATAMILRALAEKVGPHFIAVVAPTNAAAVRMRQSLKKCNLESVSCGTVHGTLGVMRNGRDGGGWGFLHTKDNPLPFDVIAIEEASMISTEDAADLFEAIRPGSLALVIGDHHQLMPVAHGATLRDMRSAGIPNAELTEVLRNGGDGLEACRAIRDGKPAKPSDHIELAAGKNWRHWHAGTGKQSLAELVRILTSISGVEIPATDLKPAFTVDPIRDVQVIVALNEKGDCNRKAVNELLQQTLNPNGQRVEGIQFRVGDKVICTDKCILPAVEGDGANYDPDREPDDDEEPETHLIVKGEMGLVVAVSPRGVVLRFFATHERRVFVPRGKSGADQHSPLNWFELGYAITFHKSQGSQYPIVICLADCAANRVACRELWYVGTSRFEVLLGTIGELGVIYQQCRRIALKDRKTFLVERLRDGLNHA